MEFEGCQNLQKFQWKLAQLLPAIDGNIAVMRMCEEVWNEKPRGAGVQAAIFDVRGFIRQLEFHKESVRKLAEQAQRSTELVNPISR